jgi:hypothetical protein
MNPATKLIWLKRVLLFKTLVCLLVWGLPGLVGTAAMLGMFGITIPADPFYMRIFGAVQVCIALLYWFTYKNPVRNRDVVVYAVVDNTVSTLAIIAIALTSGLSSWFFGVSGFLTAFFALAFWYLLPPKE